MIKITYLEHSGFAVECDDYVLIFDYYKGNLPQFDKDKKICVFASHVHYDHFKKKYLRGQKNMRISTIFYLMTLRRQGQKIRRSI